MLQASPDQRNLHMLQSQLLKSYPEDGPSRLTFQENVDSRTGLLGGTLSLRLSDDQTLIFHDDKRHGSIAVCQEALAAKALGGNLWSQLSIIAQKSSIPVSLHKPALPRAERSYHPVSYVYQMCQILLGTEAGQRPIIEAFKPADVCEYRSSDVGSMPAEMKSWHKRVLLQDLPCRPTLQRPTNVLLPTTAKRQPKRP